MCKVSASWRSTLPEGLTDCMFLTLYCRQDPGPECLPLQFTSPAQGRCEPLCSWMQTGFLIYSWWKLGFFIKCWSTFLQTPTTAISILRQEVLQLPKLLINSLITKFRCIKPSLHHHSFSRGIYNTLQFDERCKLSPGRLLHLLPPTSFRSSS